jgi:hypothetical protein
VALVSCTSETVLERLLAVRVVELIEVDGVGPCVALAANGYFANIPISMLKARLATEKILLLAVKDWARKLGIVSYDKVMVRDDIQGPPKVGTFAWDLSGPSYLRSIVRHQVDGKPAATVTLSTRSSRFSRKPFPRHDYLAAAA